IRMAGIKTMNTSLAIITDKTVELSQRAKLIDAKAAAREFIEAEAALEGMHRRHLVVAWRLGQKLTALKDTVRHGHWMVYRFSTFAELGRKENTRRINVERCMKLYAANPTQNDRNPIIFEPESVRKFWWYYVPIKVRPPLEGDEREAPASHYLTFVN